MIDRGRFPVLGVRVSAADYEWAVDQIGRHARQGESLAVAAVAVHAIMTAVLDPSYRYRLNHLHLVLPDGQPVRWALNWLHHTALADRVYGPLLMARVCELSARERLPVYLYGSREPVLDRLRGRLEAQYPGLVVAGTQASRFRKLTAPEREQVIDDVRQSGARVVFVGLGCPRQEVWVYENQGRLPMPLVAVGAAFDFHAGTLPQAPPALQRAGLEWAFRLYQEPARLWRRYLLLNPAYVMLVLLQGLSLIHIDPADGDRPPQEIGYG